MLVNLLTYFRNRNKINVHYFEVQLIRISVLWHLNGHTQNHSQINNEKNLVIKMTKNNKCFLSKKKSYFDKTNKIIENENNVKK